MSRLRLRANVGDEESDGSQHAAARQVAVLWRALFDDAAEWPDAGAPERATLPERARDAPAFRWLPAAGLCAWWNDAASATEAAREGLELFGAPPEASAAVHDKAFALRVCERSGLLPRALRGRARVFEAEELRDARRFREDLREHLADWPEALAAGAVLKPRLGTSGRGRVAVSDLDSPEALEGLAAQGGAVLEPWLDRLADYSVQFHLAPDGTLTLLGVLELRVSRSGGYRGHRGEFDHRGRVHSGANLESHLLGPASELAAAAHAAGYFGPCGIDAFRFREDGREELRTVVEFNARFTMGTVLLGLLRRLRPVIDAALPPEPGTRRAFHFDFAGREPPDALPTSAHELRLDAAGSRILLSQAPIGE